MKLSRTQLLFSIIAKKDPNAKVRNRGDAVFPAGSKNVKDDKDHFPINSESQARNALSRVAQYSAAPSWYSGSLKSLQSAVRSHVKSKYPGIEVSKSGFSYKAFLVLADDGGDEGNGVGGGDTDDHNEYNGPDKPRTKPTKKKKVK